MAFFALALMLQRDGFCPMCEMMGGWGWLGMILVVLFWIAVVVAVVWLVLRLVRRRGTETHQAPEDVLRERYARGDIDRETYDRMLNELHRPGPA